MTRAEYDAIQAVNWSSLKHMRTSPLAYRYELHREWKPTPAMQMGTAIHTAVLEPDRFADKHPIWLGGRRAGNEWKAFQAEHEGREILTVAEAATALAAADAVLTHPVAGPLFIGGKREQVTTWTDPETGVDCKCIMDQLLPGGVVELKTTNTMDFDPSRFSSVCARMGYVGQVAYYDDGAREAGHAIETEPRLVVVQSAPPHDVIVYRVAGPVLAQGRALYQRLLRELVECRDADRWPGMAPNGELDLVLPAWAAEIDFDDPGPLLVGGVAVGF